MFVRFFRKSFELIFSRAQLKSMISSLWFLAQFVLVRKKMMNKTKRLVRLLGEKDQGPEIIKCYEGIRTLERQVRVLKILSCVSTIFLILQFLGQSIPLFEKILVILAVCYLTIDFIYEIFIKKVFKDKNWLKALPTLILNGLFLALLFTQIHLSPIPGGVIDISDKESPIVKIKNEDSSYTELDFLLDREYSEVDFLMETKALESKRKPSDLEEVIDFKELIDKKREETNKVNTHLKDYLSEQKYYQDIQHLQADPYTPDWDHININPKSLEKNQVIQDSDTINRSESRSNKPPFNQEEFNRKVMERYEVHARERENASLNTKKRIHTPHDRQETARRQMYETVINEQNRAMDEFDRLTENDLVNRLDKPTEKVRVSWINTNPNPPNE